MRAPARRICDTPDACRAISPEVIFVTVSDKIIRLKTDLPVVPARVWDVLTGARHIEAWWGRHVALTPRAGGGVLIRADGSDRGRDIRGRVLRWSPPSALELALSDEAWASQTRVNIRLESTGDGTRLLLDHTGWDGHDDTARHQIMAAWDRDWTSRLARLRAYITRTSDGGAAPAPHAVAS